MMFQAGFERGYAIERRIPAARSRVPEGLFNAARDVFEAWNKHGAHSRKFDDAMFALAQLLAAAPEAQQGAEPVSRDESLFSLDMELRGINGVSIVDGQKRITSEGLKKGMVATRWYSSSRPHKLPAGSGAFCSCCNNKVSIFYQWNTMLICTSCWDAAQPAPEPREDGSNSREEQLFAGGLEPVSPEVKEHILAIGREHQANELRRMGRPVHGAQPAPEPRGEAEPVAHVVVEPFNGGRITKIEWPSGACGLPYGRHALYTAQPAAEARALPTTDELRAMFERWQLGDHYPALQLDRLSNGQYQYIEHEMRWQAFQACASAIKEWGGKQ